MLCMEFCLFVLLVREELVRPLFGECNLSYLQSMYTEAHAANHEPIHPNMFICDNEIPDGTTEPDINIYRNNEEEKNANNWFAYARACWAPLQVFMCHFAFYMIFYVDNKFVCAVRCALRMSFGL